MAEKITEIKCPACGASLSVETGKKQIVCEYCDTTIFLNNDNEKINRNIDEAEIKKSENEKIIKLKEMEMEEKKRADAKKAMLVKIIVSLVLIVAGVVMIACGEINAAFYPAGMFSIMAVMWIWLFTLAKRNKESSNVNKVNDGNKIELPESVFDYEKKSYMAIRECFIEAGFSNIKCIPLNDLTMGLLKKPNWVESITINGDDIETGEDEYSPNAKIVIYYHSKSY